MHGGGPAPFAVLLKLDFTHHELLIFGAPIVNALALRALQLDKSILGHEREYTL